METKERKGKDFTKQAVKRQRAKKGRGVREEEEEEKRGREKTGGHSSSKESFVSTF